MGRCRFGGERIFEAGGVFLDCEEAGKGIGVFFAGKGTSVGGAGALAGFDV